MELNLEKDLQKKLNDFFKGKDAVIVDPTTSTRSTIKKILNSLGFPLSSIHIVGDFYQAAEIVREKMAAIIFSAGDLGKKNAQDLLDLHVDLIPNRENCVFMVVSKQNSEASAASYIDTEVDSYICQPFTTVTLQNAIIEAFTKKVNQTRYQREVCKIKSHIHKNDFEEALVGIDNSMQLSDDLVWTYYLKGLVYEKQGNLEAAREEYQVALSYSERHFQTLTGLMRTYQGLRQYGDAYSAANALLSRFPLAINQIPDLIRICLANRKFEDLEKLSLVLNQVPDLSENIRKYISAGLAMCGKHLLISNQSKDIALRSLKRALESSDDNVHVVVTVGRTYLECNYFNEALHVANSYEDKLGDSEEFKIFELELFYQTSETKGQVLTLGNELLQKNIKRPRVYEIIIQASIELKRRNEAIEQLVHDASSEHPNLKSFFQSFLN
ncbi:tetratricopeptide repeat protein [Bacteriovorax sp. BSW11_IV]|uniref:tetratricopeptide repeat protein n=1 Tax=Bacteriovorax sp. BSW11_IV TaxID=1353529 RepID=UPI00038A1D6C|nr:tetratricopeptide repeat protein [Bacteriovorax sp. BSW11_IV]EQC46734.1 tetratricopeptide repeat protein [Bacteriovorax sp. BSW11_IV]